MNKIDLSIIILCYQTGEQIRKFAESADIVASSLTERYEIILVANYHENEFDNTPETVQDIASGNNHIKVLCYPKRGMMGWDMKMGLKESKGDYICVIDGDGQFPLDSIQRCYREISNGTFDLVKTYRIKRHDGFYRWILSETYNIIFSLLFPGLKCRDINSKPKMITRRAYEHMTLNADDWFIDAEIMLNIRRHCMPFFEFPIEFGALSDRPSFVRIPAILEFLRNLIIYRLREFRSDQKWQ